MARIYKYHLSYALVREYFMFCFKRFYGEYTVTGRENIPETGPVIFAANHVNALMDPLAVISVIPRKLPIIYMGRSDMFKGKKFTQFLRFIKLVPAFRMRDGIENLEKNKASFEQCDEVLERNLALGIMPEGNQGSFRRIRPLVKGIFRIAFKAQQKYGNSPGVKIVPIGIDYNNLEKFGQKIIINIGKPIEVAEYMENFKENEVKAINTIRSRLYKELVNLTVHISSEKHYYGFETATELTNSAVTHQLNLDDKPLNRFYARQKTAQWLNKLEFSDPETAERIDRLSNNYKKNLQQLHLRDWIFEVKPSSILNILLSTLGLILTFPIFITGLLLNVLPFFAPDVVRKIFKIHFPGGLSSLRFVSGMISFPLFYILQGIYIYKKFELNFLSLLFIIPLQYITGKLSFTWYKSFRKLSAKIRFKFPNAKNFELLKETLDLHSEITGLVQPV